MKQIAGFFTLFALVCGVLTSSAQTLAQDDWRSERWTIEPFTQALGGGPETGPVEHSGASVSSMCSDAHGNLYLADGQFIDIVTTDGIRHHLAGTGRTGYRDGPGHLAQFRMGVGIAYGPFNIACTPDGRVFIADIGNAAVRQLKWNESQVDVTTVIGGNLTIQDNYQAPRLRGALSLAYRARDGHLIVAMPAGAFDFDPKTAHIRKLGEWPIKDLAKGVKPRHFKPYMGDSDNHGSIYFVSRNPEAVVRVDIEGNTKHIAGLIRRGGKKPHHIGDGPPLEAYFDTPNSLVADPNGRAVYVNGGDEYDIRRVPTDLQSTTATLMSDGKWYVSPVHPNKLRGAAIFTSATTDTERANLGILMVSPLVGRDGHSNLYGRLVSWRGLTQVKDGTPLTTRVFRIRRLSDSTP